MSRRFATEWPEVSSQNGVWRVLSELHDAGVVEIRDDAVIIRPEVIDAARTG